MIIHLALAVTSSKISAVASSPSSSSSTKASISAPSSN
jgi:hypothetical protein